MGAVAIKMNKSYQIDNDGIAIFDGYFSEEMCDFFIRHFNERHKFRQTYDRQSVSNIPAKHVTDTSISYMDEEFFTSMPVQDYGVKFNDIFWGECYPLYFKKFFVLENCPVHKIYHVNLQRTLPSQGYHIWHNESATVESLRRLLVFILYLNDVEDGGETEFLYLSRRVQPKKGRLLLWPTGFMHTHRGNPPLKEAKYVLTGWVEI